MGIFDSIPDTVALNPNETIIIKCLLRKFILFTHPYKLYARSVVDIAVFIGLHTSLMWTSGRITDLIRGFFSAFAGNCEFTEPLYHNFKSSSCEKSGITGHRYK